VEKAKSFYDWEQKFRAKSPSHPKKDIKQNKKINSLGIEESEFWRFLKKWKKKNLRKRRNYEGKK